MPEINKIVATGRTLIKSRTITSPKVKYRLGDLTDLDFVDSLFEDIDIVINTALSLHHGEIGIIYKVKCNYSKKYFKVF